MFSGRPNTVRKQKIDENHQDGFGEGTGASPAMGLNWLTLRFTGAHTCLEPGFLVDYSHRNLLQIRLALIAGLAIYMLFAILDALVIPSMKHFTWLIRFGYVTPLILTILALTWFPRWRRRMQPLLASAFIASGTGIIVMIAIIPSPVNVYYYVGLILTFIFGYTLIFLRFIWAACSGLLITILYSLAAWQVAIPRVEMLSISFFLLSANLAGMMACYSIEYSSRRSYFLLHHLATEKQKTAALNDQLEQRVTERTEMLEEANQHLIQEMMEHQQAEADRIKLAAQLKQAEKMETIGKLAAGVAHDLNNLLIGLVTYPEFLLLEIPTDSKMRRHIEIIRQSGLKAGAIVQDLLSLSRQGVVEKQVLNLNTVITEYVGSPTFIQLQKQSPHVQLLSELDEDLLNMSGSSIQMMKIVMNLIINAFEANLVEGSVKISTHNHSVDRPFEAYESIPEGEYVILSVSDTGIGIEEDDQKRMFEPFFSKKKLGRSGTGLGMTLVWSMVKEHQGYIDIQSREGQGTVIHIYLPSSRLSVSSQNEALTLKDCMGTETVLVVDDMDEQREIATLMLQKLGYQVFTASSGEEAVAYFINNQADIIILDMIMDPGMDGLDTYRKIREHHPGQKALIVSGYSKSERVDEAQRLGAGSYVRKPYTLLQIARALRSELDHSNKEHLTEEN